MRHCKRADAFAKIRGSQAYPDLCGVVHFFRTAGGVILEAEIYGLPITESGFFAMHIHEGNSCLGENFSRSGMHYNPAQHNHPNHSGDLPPLLGDKGMAYMKVFTSRSDLKSIIGRTVMIHIGPDDFKSQPAGNAGLKIACGVIQKL